MRDRAYNGHNAPRMSGILAMMILIMLPGVCSTYDQTAGVALPDAHGRPNIQIITMKYDPFPVGPGEYFEVWMKIGNEGDGDISDFAFELMPGFPFIIDGSETATRHFGKLLGNSMVLVRYKVRVSPDAVTGDTPLKYRYRFAESDLVWEEGQEDIRIQTREGMLDIRSVETLPLMIEPGKEGDVTITLKNLGSSVLRDVSVFLDLTMSTVAKNPSTLAPTAVLLDTYYNAIPLVPIGSSTEKRIDYIKPGEEVDIVYHVSAFPDAKAKTYKVPVLIVYQDELSKNYTKANIIGLTIGSEPDLSVFIVDNKIYGKSATGDVSVKLVNKGITDIKFMNVILNPSEDYEIISSDTVYVGSLDSDDYENADFKLYVKDLEKGDMLKLPLTVEYEDANGIDYKKDIVLEMKAYSLAQRGMSSNSKAWMVVILVVLMVAGWFIYKRWEKKKKKKQ